MYMLSRYKKKTNKQVNVSKHDEERRKERKEEIENEFCILDYKFVYLYPKN